MSRRNDVFERLDYADHRFNELCEAIFEGGRKATDVKFLGTMAGDVLANAREVFDYCARDIFETHISPTNPDVTLEYNKGKLRVYYPFYKQQLAKKGAAFSLLKNSNKLLHERLFSIAAYIEKDKLHPGTIMNYGCLQQMCDMINQKKHDRLLAVKPSGGKTVFAESPGIKTIIPMNEQVGVSYIQLPEGTKHNVGDSYVYEYNKEDVMKFTMKCKNLSRILMDEVYGRFLT